MADSSIWERDVEYGMKAFSLSSVAKLSISTQSTLEREQEHSARQKSAEIYVIVRFIFLTVAEPFSELVRHPRFHQLAAYEEKCILVLQGEGSAYVKETPPMSGSGFYTCQS